uniref:Uncharacterized protein n=1 Tax=Anguilla anguilla TaxID=7936 RepID=A0A0E9X1Z8_ANGAN
MIIVVVIVLLDSISTLYTMFHLNQRLILLGLSFSIQLRSFFHFIPFKLLFSMLLISIRQPLSHACGVKTIFTQLLITFTDFLNAHIKKISEKMSLKRMRGVYVGS